MLLQHDHRDSNSGQREALQIRGYEDSEEEQEFEEPESIESSDDRKISSEARCQILGGKGFPGKSVLQILSERYHITLSIGRSPKRA